MRKILLMLAFFPVFGASGQAFSGLSANKYKCSIGISTKGDSTVTFTYSLDNNVVYAWYLGKIKKVRDSLYHITAKMEMGQFAMKSYTPDTLYIKIDTANISLDGIAKLQYSNKEQEYLKLWDENRKSIPLVRFGFDKSKFNEKRGKNYVDIYLKSNRESLTQYKFTVPYDSSLSFQRGEKLEMDVMIHQNSLWTIGNAPLQTGHFNLTEKK